MNRRTRLLFPTLLLAAGCGGAALQAPSDPAQAREALCAALDGWQRGDAPASPGGVAAAVRVVDPDWSSGYRLTRYQITGNGNRAGTDLCQRVTLTLRDLRGKTVRKATAYLVGTSPVPAVVRQDPDS